jgi:hypothetical protein
MYRSVLIAVMLTVLGGFSLVEAHDARLHKGKPTKGEVVSLVEQDLKLKTTTGMITVTVSDKTKFERGDQTVTRDDLKPGQQVGVFGTKLPSGELVAREILLPAMNSAPSSPASHADQSKEGTPPQKGE